MLLLFFSEQSCTDQSPAWRE